MEKVVHSMNRVTDIRLFCYSILTIDADAIGNSDYPLKGQKSIETKRRITVKMITESVNIN